MAIFTNAYVRYTVAMNLIFLYGPPAVGKQTVGGELAKLLGYKILDNHKSVEMLRQLFPFEDPELNTIRRRLQRKFRLEMFEEAAKAGVNFITTCATAGEQHFGFYRETKALVEKHGGHVYFVQLAPTKAAMLKRVDGASRKGIKVESQEHLLRLLAAEPELFETFPDEPHLVLDNSALSPAEAAEKIREYYKV
jgi:shikimate kinase